MIRWLTESGIIYSCNEKSSLPNDLYIRFYSDVENAYTLLSSNFPSTVEIGNPIKIADNTYSIKISGSVPSVPETTEFSICARLKENNEILDGTFSLNVINVPIEWSPDIPDVIEFTVNTYSLYKLKIENSNDNEIIKKIAGSFPPGISMGNDGSIFGTITDESLIDNIYTSMVTVFIDNVAIDRMNKEIKIKVVAADPYDKPQWVTEEGYIGSIYADKKSTLRIVATNSTSTQALFYRLLSGSNLPDGITLDSEGKLVGTTTTKRTQNWTFSAVAFKIVEQIHEVESEPRDFYLTTNPTSSDDEIIWEDKEAIVDLGKCVIGQDFYGRILAYTKSGLHITYTMIGDYPKGLSLSSDGIFSGTIEPQEVKDYIFTVQASTTVSSSLKSVKITLKKGLGKYATTLSFPIWLENIGVYNSILAKFDKNQRYKPYNKNFKLYTQPKIDICVIKSFDKELLPLILNFAYPEWIRFGKTQLRNVVSIDRYDHSVLDDYDVIYKTFDEATYQWDDLYNGSYKWDEHLPEGASLKWNVYHYNAENDLLPNDNQPPKPINKYYVMNIPNIRERLTHKIYLKQLSGTYWYYSVDQRIVEDLSEYTEDELENNNVLPITIGGVASEIIKIENPYVYSAELNPEYEEVTDFVLPYINDIVEEEDGKIFCTLFDEDNEILPYWKRKEPVVWTVMTHYDSGVVLLYDENYYLTTGEFTSTYNFNDNLEYVHKLSYSEVELYLSKNYFPCVEFGYYIAGKNAKNVQEINVEEEKGKYWTNEIFVFDEVIAAPYFDSGIDSYTITITYPNLGNYPKGILEKE